MHKLLKKYPIISEQVEEGELTVILQTLEQVIATEVPGDVVELGCYEGTTALFLQRILRAQAPDKTLHVYDSFAGLPPKTAPDQSPAGEQFVAGALHAKKSHLIKHFKQASLPLPVIHAGWFNQLQPTDLPTQISFAFLDGDFYESILESLRLVWPKLTKGAIVIVDDYHSETLPGARVAVEQWLRNHSALVTNIASLAVIRPR